MDRNVSVTTGQFLRDFGAFCAAALGVALAVAAVAGTLIVLIRSLSA